MINIGNKFIQVGQLSFAYIEQGIGPTVILLHGFPDHALTWSHQIEALSAKGYRVIAPYLKGYPPTVVPLDGFYDKATLVHEVAQFTQMICPQETCHLVGQDWGAIIGYGLLAAYPELFRRAVLMAVPHPEKVGQSILDAKHIHRSFHWWFFQLKDLPEKAILQSDMAFIDYLWEYWTVEGFKDEDHIRSVKQMLSQPGVLTATLGYYRAMFDQDKFNPDHAELRGRMARPICVPTLALCGAEDLRSELMLEQSQYFSSEYEFQLIEKAGHFLHREQPQSVTDQILIWLKK
jgi:pimeloyl-ACP methyl ester carboxylesterase